MLAIGFMPMSFHAYVTGDINRILDPNTDDFRRLRQYYGVDETLFAPLLDEINERHKIYEARMNEYFALRGDFSAWNG
jgi:transposase-like protein